MKTLLIGHYVLTLNLLHYWQIEFELDFIEI